MGAGARHVKDTVSELTPDQERQWKTTLDPVGQGMDASDQGRRQGAGRLPRRSSCRARRQMTRQPPYRCDRLARRHRQALPLVTRAVAFAGVVAMLLVAFVTIADVLLRWLFNAPINGLNEIVGVLDGGRGRRHLSGRRIAAGQSHHRPAARSHFRSRAGLAESRLRRCCCSSSTRCWRWRIGCLRMQAAEARATRPCSSSLPIAPFVWVICAFRRRQRRHANRRAVLTYLARCRSSPAKRMVAIGAAARSTRSTADQVRGRSADVRARGRGC